ncbi:hypothetical protein C5167_032239 [Papaver somniferum]|uniref:CCT domain-containing protein n=1 Tax=Papaver somniferum TaxID=3469 RepID=A0A4Y7K9Z4_PAPSO|nr:zinc finger protein CONSTANS-like [Papaver somniferum]RZC69170.1 hypothetical protein C5167_032239 [Papaver somniferum]
MDYAMYDQQSIQQFLLYLAKDETNELVYQPTNNNWQLFTPSPPPPPAPATTRFIPKVPFFGGMLTESFEDVKDFSSIITTRIRSIAAAARKAKVLRYKEKKKRRNFMKKIRYPSRKAYAEIRPRIRGRFIKVPTPNHPIVNHTELSS